MLNRNQITPSWSSFNSILTKENRSIDKVAFLPVLPAPVTDYSVVYTELCNFLDLLDQLDQEFLSVFCDEGVYKIARQIIFENQEKFRKIILCLGNFHTIKIVQGMIGRCITNSGVESIFIETELFGIDVTEKILKGSRYDRCVKAYTYLAEALRRLQFKEFFTPDRLKRFEQQIVAITMLQESLQVKNFEECQKLFGEKTLALY